MQFFLGAFDPRWLEREDIGVPLFVSRRRLERVTPSARYPRRRLPRAVVPWALDSGGFTELSTYGEWHTTVDDYVELVTLYAEEIGRLEWAAPMDFMCEPWIVEKTGLSVAEHQRRTVENFLALRGRGPFVPVLQGWTEGDYHRCVELYDDAGVDLLAEPLVGLGTVCRRQATDEAGRIVGALTRDGMRVHGFGVKMAGLARCGHQLTSADSMAWSTGGRMAGLHGRGLLCDGGERHEGGKTCANCPAWALRWRDRVVDRLGLFSELAR